MKCSSHDNNGNNSDICSTFETKLLEQFTKNGTLLRNIYQETTNRILEDSK